MGWGGCQGWWRCCDFGTRDRDLGADLGDLGPHLGLARLEVVGRDVVALLGELPQGVGEAVSLGRREVGGGQ